MGRALVDDVNQEIITAGAAAPQSDPVGATAEVRASAEIAASIAQQVTYATHQNEVPVIADLRLANRGEEDLEDLVLTLLVDPPLITEKRWRIDRLRSEEHTSELQSLMRISYAVFCLKKKN